MAKGVDPVISDNFAIIVYYELAHSSYVCVCQLARDNHQLTADVMATIPVQVRLGLDVVEWCWTGLTTACLQGLAVADMALCESDLWLLGGGAGSCEVVHVDLRSMRQNRTPLWADRGGEVAVPSGTTVQASHVTSCDQHVTSCDIM